MFVQRKGAAPVLITSLTSLSVLVLATIMILHVCFASFQGFCVPGHFPRNIYLSYIVSKQQFTFLKIFSIYFKVKYVPNVTKNMKVTVLLLLLGQAWAPTMERRQS